MIQYNNVCEKGRIAKKGGMLPDGGARLPVGYITLVLTKDFSSNGQQLKWVITRIFV